MSSAAEVVYVEIAATAVSEPVRLAAERAVARATADLRLDRAPRIRWCRRTEPESKEHLIAKIDHRLWRLGRESGRWDVPPPAQVTSGEIAGASQLLGPWPAEIWVTVGYTRRETAHIAVHEAAHLGGARTQAAAESFAHGRCGALAAEGESCRFCAAYERGDQLPE